MSITNNEIASLTNLIGEVVRTELRPVQEEIRQFRSEVNSSFDALFKRDETRQEEYITVRAQLSNLEKKIA